jgi:hypothetical protein
MELAAVIHGDEAMVIVHEPSRRYIGADFELCDDADAALLLTHDDAAETIIARHASEPGYAVLLLLEALAA